MAWQVVLPLVLAGLILFVLVVFLAKARRALLVARRAATFRRRLTSLGAEYAAVSGPLLNAVDALRRGEQAPETVEAVLVNGRRKLWSVAEEMRALETPASLLAGRNLLAEQLEAGSRALEMVVHGCTLSGRHETAVELEAETRIKRGYLNLVHAVEGVQEQVAALTDRSRFTAEGGAGPVSSGSLRPDH